MKDRVKDSDIFKTGVVPEARVIDFNDPEIKKNSCCLQGQATSNLGYEEQAY